MKKYENILKLFSMQDIESTYDGDMNWGIQQVASDMGYSEELCEELALYYEYKTNKKYWTVQMIRQVEETLQ